MFAAKVMSSSTSCASWYSGLGCRECDGLVEGRGFNRLYGSCANHPLPVGCALLSCGRKPGGDHGAPVLDRSSISDSSCSDLKPECCDGRSNSGERRWYSSTSSIDAVSDTRSSKPLSRSSIIAATCFRNMHEMDGDNAEVEVGGR
jgi:hypothetical protein